MTTSQNLRQTSAYKYNNLNHIARRKEYFLWTCYTCRPESNKHTQNNLLYILVVHLNTFNTFVALKNNAFPLGQHVFYKLPSTLLLSEVRPCYTYTGLLINTYLSLRLCLSSTLTEFSGKTDTSLKRLPKWRLFNTPHALETKPHWRYSCGCVYWACVKQLQQPQRLWPGSIKTNTSPQINTLQVNLLLLHQSGSTHHIVGWKSFSNRSILLFLL